MMKKPKAERLWAFYSTLTKKARHYNRTNRSHIKSQEPRQEQTYPRQLSPHPDRVLAGMAYALRAEGSQRMLFVVIGNSIGFI